jgi:hypothetical protein
MVCAVLCCAVLRAQKLAIDNKLWQQLAVAQGNGRHHGIYHGIYHGISPAIDLARKRLCHITFYAYHTPHGIDGNS